MRKKGVLIAVSIIVAAIAVYFIFLQSNAPKDIASSEGTTNQPTVDEEKENEVEEITSETDKNNDYNFDIYLIDEKVKYEELNEYQQLAINFVSVLINTKNVSTESDHFSIVKALLSEGQNQFSDVMGIEYLLPFQNDRQLKKVTIVGGDIVTKVQTVILLRTNDNINNDYLIPVSVSLNEKKIMGYSEKYKDVIEVMTGYNESH